MVVFPGEIAAVILDVTFTVMLAVPVQLPLMAFKVYVVVAEGETVISVFVDPVDQE